MARRPYIGVNRGFGFAEAADPGGRGGLYLRGPIVTQGMDEVPDGLPGYVGVQHGVQVVVFRVASEVKTEGGDKLGPGLYLATFDAFTGTMLGMDVLRGGDGMPGMDDVFAPPSAMPGATSERAQAMAAVGPMMPPTVLAAPAMPQAPAPTVFRGRTGVCVARTVNVNHFGQVVGSAVRVWFEATP